MKLIKLDEKLIKLDERMIKLDEHMRISLLLFALNWEKQRSKQDGVVFGVTNVLRFFFNWKL